MLEDYDIAHFTIRFKIEQHVKNMHNKKIRTFLIFQTSIQVLKWSIPDAHPDSRVLSILNFSGLFEICMRGIFYSLKDTLLFKCSEFLSL